MINELFRKLNRLKIDIQYVDGRLDIKAARGTLDNDLLNEIRAHKEELITLIRTYRNRNEMFSPIPVIEKQNGYRLSSSQRRLWILGQLPGSNVAYNIPGVYLFEGNVRVQVLQQALAGLVHRHEILRTVFREDESGEVRQYVLDAGAELGYFETDNEVAAHKLIREDCQTPFDLSQGPLLRVSLYRIAENRYLLSYVMHHIISDGWSMGIVMSELMKLYYGIELAPLRIQYRDYAAWQQEQNMEQHKNWWLQQMEGELPVLELPGDRARPKVKTYNGSSVSCVIDAAAGEGLKKICRECEATLFMGALALVNLLLYRYTGQTDIITGSPVAGRDHADLEDQVGCYVNTLALRTKLQPAKDFAELLSAVRNITLGAYEHQAYPFDELVDALHLQRDMSRHPLFDVMVLLNNREEPQKKYTTGKLKISEYKGMDHAISKFDWMFLFEEKAETLQLHIEYNSDLYSAATMARVCEHVKNLLSAILSQPGLPISSIDYLSGEEKLLLESFNDTTHSFPHDSTIIQLFEQQAASRPGAIALVFEDNRYTYKELDEVSNQLAGYLKRQYQAGREDIIGIKLERSEKLIISILGILKSGGAYMPVDPSYPDERVAYMISDSRCKTLIDEQWWQAFREQQHEYAAINLPLQSTPSDLLYVIYTSGSTGRPKGCMLENRGVVNRLEWMWTQYGFATDDIILQKTTFTFDVSVWEIFLPLCWGAKMVLCHRDDIHSPARILSLIETQQITCLHFVPGMLNAFINGIGDRPQKQEALQSLRRIITSGEALLPEMVRNWYQLSAAPLHNLYGPTEASVDVTHYTTSAADSIVPIGRPVWNTQIYILNEAGLQQPVGIAGEICIRGIQLARGYLNKHSLTNEKFAGHPFAPHTRLYKTGDLGRWLPDGNIEFLGRKDDQVKIRGHRIEPGEIESVLQGHEDIGSAVVLTRPGADGGNELVAYITANVALNATALKTWLNGILPDYMAPSRFVQVDEMPLTASGKVDRKKLAASATAEMQTGIAYLAPRNITEQKLARIWQQVLEVQQVGALDNFFTLGGHSLKMITLAGLIHKEFNVKPELKDLFGALVLQDQARLIDLAAGAVFNTIMPAPLMHAYPLSSSQRRLWLLSQSEQANTAYNISGTYVFEGDLDIAAFNRSLERLISRHEIVRTVFREDDSGNAVQIIRDAGESNIVLQVADLRQSPENLQRIISEQINTPFNLATGPLVRAALYRSADHTWIFNYVLHHIISDAWSMRILMEELLINYNACLDNEPDPLPPLRIQYKDYAWHEQQQLQDALLAQHRAYWLQQLQGELPVLELIPDKPRPAVKTYRGAITKITLNAGVTAAMKAIGQQQDATLFMSLVTAVNLLLHSYTGQQDIIVGTTIATRGHHDLSGQIGFYTNTLALRTQFSSTDNFTELLQRVRAVTLGAYDHQVYPFDVLIGELDLPRDMSRNPLFDVLVELHPKGNASGRTSFKNLRAGLYGVQGEVWSKFDLRIVFIETGDELEAMFEYSTDLFDAHTMERMAGCLQLLMQTVASQPDRPIHQLDFLTQSEKHQLLAGFNNTARDYPLDKTVVDLFAGKARSMPAQNAVIYKKTARSFRELDEKSDQLAACLRNEYQLQANDLVGIMMNRSEGMIIAILGILKSGAAYVPIDPVYPEARKRYIIEDAQVKVMITESDFIFNLAYYEGAIFAMDIQSATLPPARDAGGCRPQPEHLAYVIYTSGSTGQPKGCAVTHKNLSNYIQWANEYYFSRAANVSFGLFTSLSFDLTVTSIFCPLTKGGQLTIYDQHENLADILAHICSRESGINSIKLTPSHISLLKHLKISSDTLLHAIIGGEEVTQEHIGVLKSVNPHMELYNEYGPTETTVGCIVEPLQLNQAVLIGKPVANTQIFILRNGNLCPIGVAGEICIGGVQVTKGYLNKPGLTQEKFINRFEQLLYCSGDLGRWMPDGKIQFLGRKDDQVKIRGYRIELQEIEKVLRNYGPVDSVIVLAAANDTHEKELVAWFTGSEPVDTTDLAAYAATELPSYMLPGCYIQVSEMPLTPNGKIDRKRLPDPSGERKAAGYLAPRNEAEQKLVAIWEDLLERKPVGVKDNFFALGGHSLKAIRLVAQIHKVFEVKIELKDLFTAVVIEEQARLIEKARRSAFSLIPKVAEQTDYPVSSAQRLFWTACQFEEANIAYNISRAYVVEGALQTQALASAFQQLIRRHESLRTVFRENNHGELRQHIYSGDEPGFTLRTEKSTTQQLKKLLNLTARQPFHLATGPLIRATLYQLENNKWVFAYTMHHIVSDGWSMSIFINELLKLYNACSNGEDDLLPALDIQYKDYSAWEQEQLNSEEGHDHRQYWLKQFEGDIPVLQLATDRHRPAFKTFKGAIVREVISLPVSAAFKNLLRESDCTLFMGVLAAVNALLHRYTGQEDIVIGTSVAGRQHVQLENQIGYYLNTLALRTRFHSENNFIELLQQVKKTTVDAYSHQVYPFDQLVQELHLRRDVSRNYLFDVLVVLQDDFTDNKNQQPHTQGITVHKYDGEEHHDSKFDLTFSFIEFDEELNLYLEYNTDLFFPETAARIAADWHRLLSAVVDQPYAAIGINEDSTEQSSLFSSAVSNEF